MGKHQTGNHKKGRLSATLAMNIQTNGTYKVTSPASGKIGLTARKRMT
jgi:hypothetical protein